MPLTFNDIMDELPMIRQQLDIFLTNYSIISVELNCIGFVGLHPEIACYYPKRDKKAIALVRLRIVPNQYLNTDERPWLIFSVYIYEDYSLYFRGDEELFPILKPFFTNYKETILSKHDNEYKAQQFMNACKRELMEKAWHPRRVASWLDAGLKLEDI